MGQISGTTYNPRKLRPRQSKRQGMVKKANRTACSMCILAEREPYSRYPCTSATRTVRNNRGSPVHQTTGKMKEYLEPSQQKRYN